MSFAIVTDTTSNLRAQDLTENDIVAIPFPYFINNKEYICTDLEKFDDTQYYESIKNGLHVTTSQINPQRYIDYMMPLLEDGRDILFIGLSSGISGSFSSAVMAKNQLLQKYPQRSIELIDSLGASLGEGLLVLRAAKCRKNGMSLEETAHQVVSIRDKMYQVFIVDDLMHLKRTGRLSGGSAILGSVLGIKPLLKGNQEGKIVPCGKVRGRRLAIKALADKYLNLAQHAVRQIIGITYSCCKSDAEYLADIIREKFNPKDIMLLKHEPVTGSHLGPGAIALYFEGIPGVRLK